MSTPVFFFITLPVKAEYLSDFETLLSGIAISLPKVHGCNGVTIFHRAAEAADGDVTRFSLLENWQARQFHETHVAQMQSSGDWARIEAMLAAAPEGFYLSEF